MADDHDAMDHYAVLGMSLEGSSTPIQRVMNLASIPLDEVKLSYKRSLLAAAGNPFRLAKLAQAFQVLSGESRKAYDLKLMEMAASVAWFSKWVGSQKHKALLYSNCIHVGVFWQSV